MITIVVGTNRPGSRSAQLADDLEPVYRNLGQTVARINLIDLPASLFDPSAYAAKPPEFQPFIDKVLAASGLVVVTPEYNGGPPGVLKYFLDHLPFPASFERRPVCFVGLAAGTFGGLRAVEQLQQIFGYRDAHVFPERVFIPHAGKPTPPDIAQRLERQAKGFVEFVAALKGEGPQVRRVPTPQPAAAWVERRRNWNPFER